MSHRIAEVHVLDAPAVPLELVDNHPTEILVVDGIVAAQGGAVVVENDGLVLVRGVVGAEVGHKFGQLALELDVKRFNDVKAFAGGLTHNKPVDVGVIVHAYAKGRIRVHVCVRFAGYEVMGYEVIAVHNLIIT